MSKTGWWALKRKVFPPMPDVNMIELKEQPSFFISGFTTHTYMHTRSDLKSHVYMHVWIVKQSDIKCDIPAHSFQFKMVKNINYFSQPPKILLNLSRQKNGCHRKRLKNTPHSSSVTKQFTIRTWILYLMKDLE